jgi:hypothetical protein
MLARPMYVQVAATIAITTATSTRTGRQAPHRTASNVSLLFTVVLIGLVLVTLIWSMSELDAEV